MELINNELESARKNLQEREALQVIMKSVNNIIKSKKTSDEEKLKEIEALGAPHDKAYKLVHGQGWDNRKGYASFELTNNNAQIRRLKERVATLEVKSFNATEGNQEREEMGVKVVTNYDEDRIQLLFPGKPDAKIREHLNAGGWNWSPTNEAWQRKITANAEWAVKRFFEFMKAESLTV